ncbi:MAG: hypothetical protein ABIH23_04450 [bacterium]
MSILEMEGGYARGRLRSITCKSSLTAACGSLTVSLADPWYDLFANFTFFLNDLVNGDAFQQHDSRLVEGANV